MNRSMLEKFLRLDGDDRRLLVCCACVLAAMRIGLWILPVRRLRRVAEWGASAQRPRSARPSTVRIAWAIAAAARYIPGATCLPQALAAEVVLTRHDYPARLCIGVAPTGPGGVRGHAWVESSEGLVIGGMAGYHDALLQGVAGEGR